MRSCLRLLVCTVLFLSAGQTSAKKCPGVAKNIDECTEADLPLNTDVVGAFRGLSSCRIVYLNPNAMVLCKEYKAISKACPCICQIAECETRKLENNEDVNAEVEADLERQIWEVPQEFFGCFDESGSVITDEQKQKTMKDLAVDDLKTKVEVVKKEGGLGFEKVDLWYHRDSKKEEIFLKLSTESGHSITLTPNHFIYKTECIPGGSSKIGKTPAVWANTVEVGDCLWVKGSEGNLVQSRVLKVEKKILKGVYAFKTRSGTVMVNGVAASNYSVLKNEKLARMIVSVYDQIMSWLPEEVSEMIEINLPVLNLLFSMEKSFL